MKLPIRNLVQKLLEQSSNGKIHAPELIEELKNYYSMTHEQYAKKAFLEAMMNNVDGGLFPYNKAADECLKIHDEGCINFGKWLVNYVAGQQVENPVPSIEWLHEQFKNDKK